MKRFQLLAAFVSLTLCFSACRTSSSRGGGYYAEPADSAGADSTDADSTDADSTDADSTDADSTDADSTGADPADVEMESGAGPNSTQDPDVIDYTPKNPTSDPYEALVALVNANPHRLSGLGKRCATESSTTKLSLNIQAYCGLGLVKTFVVRFDNFDEAIMRRAKKDRIKVELYEHGTEDAALIWRFDTQRDAEAFVDALTHIAKSQEPAPEPS